MPQFDLYRLSDDMLVKDVQTDLLPLDRSRIVAPLGRRGSVPELTGLNPVLRIGEQAYIVRLQQVAAIDGSLLRQPIGNAAHLRDAVTRGLDLLLHGL